MTQRLIHQGPGISFQLGYSLQMWRLRAVTLPPRSLCSDLLSRVGNLNTGVHVGLGPSAALPLLNRAGSWLIPLCQGGMRMQRNGLHPLCLHWALLRGGRQLLKDSSACPFPLCLRGHYRLVPITHWALAGTSWPSALIPPASFASTWLSLAAMPCLGCQLHTSSGCSSFTLPPTSLFRGFCP